MTEPAVRSILTRARKALRKEYALRGGTLPVGGLAVIAPWIGGLRLADRIRAAAIKIAAPAAMGAVALGLVGGALHSPLFNHGGASPAQAQAVVSTTLTSPASGVSDAAIAHPTRIIGVRTAVARTARPAHVAANPSWAERTPTSSSCVHANDHPVAGGDACLHGGTGNRVWVNQALPDNPTGIHYLGVEGTGVDCKYIPTNPVISCTPSTPNGAKP
jgi:hypothetical protein